MKIGGGGETKTAVRFPTSHSRVGKVFVAGEIKRNPLGKIESAPKKSGEVNSVLSSISCTEMIHKETYSDAKRKQTSHHPPIISPSIPKKITTHSNWVSDLLKRISIGS